MTDKMTIEKAREIVAAFETLEATSGKDGHLAAIQAVDEFCFEAVPGEYTPRELVYGRAQGFLDGYAQAEKELAEERARAEKLGVLLRRSVAKLRIYLDQTGNVYKAGENTGWLIGDIEKELAPTPTNGAEEKGEAS